MKLTLATTIALTLFTITLVSSLPPPVAATATSFTFATSGDHGSLTSTTGAANLNLLHSTSADFYLSLGDMSYNPSTTGDIWCGQFKSKFNNIAILPGDHDTGGHPPNFNETRSYEKYLSGCPYNLNPAITCGPVEGACYGKEYYFDYPAGNPIARLISLSPKIFNITGQCTTCCSSQCSPSTPCTAQNDCWVYDKNTLHYNWTRTAIDDARNKGIKWVIVATHKVCISSSDATCSIGIDLFNLLVSKKVDLIIQAHDNAYERSKQLALNTSTCNSINTDSNGYTVYNSNCVSDSGSRGYYTPGVGSVVVVQGAWINDLYAVNGSSPHPENVAEAPYFVKLMGSNTPGSGSGFVKYSVTPDRIDVQTFFSGAFQDSFSIWPGPNPVPFAAWTPSNPQVGQIVTFNASVIGGTPPYSFSWNFGDGVTTTGSVVRHFYVNPRTFNVTLTAIDANNASGSTRRTIAVGSWNPSVGCSPTLTTVEAIVGSVSVQRNATNSNSKGPDYSGGIFKLDGPHAYNSSFSTWPFSKRNLQPPCLANGAAAFIEVHNVQVISTPTPGIATYDCRTQYDISNGKGPFPNGRDCDYIFNVGNGSITGCPNCDFHRIYSEIDGDWNASGVAPLPGPSQGATIDIQGFVYWDNDSKGFAEHSYTGWEIHPVTGWRISRPPLSVSFSTSPTSPAVGQAETFTATATGGTTPYVYTWDFGDGNTTKGASNQVTHTYSSTGVRIAQLYVNDSQGATGTSTKNITVVTSITVTVTCGTATSGKPVTCNASATGGTSPFAFSWSAAGGTPSTGSGASFTTTYSAKGTFVVNATATDGNNAKKSQTATIVVVAQPIIVTVTCGSATSGKPVSCNASATGGTGPYTFLWSAPGGTPASGTGAGFTTTYATKGTFIVNATATDLNNVRKSQTVSLVVTAQPMVVTVTCGSATSGKPVTCNASATGGTSPYAFSWTSTSSSPSSGTSSSFTTTFPAKGTFTIKTIVIDANGSNSSNTTSVTVTPQQLVVDFTYTQPLVAGTTGTFTGTATGGTSPYAFKWNFGDSPPIQTGNPASHSYTIQGSYTVTLNVTDTNSVSLTVQKTVLVTAGLLVSFSYDPVAPTVQQTVSFNATISGGTGPYSASWVFGDNNNGLGATVSHVYNTFGNYTVTLTVTDANSATATSGRILTVSPEINVSRAPAASFQTIFNGTAAMGTGGIIFHWSFGDGTNGTGLNVSHVFATNGTYTVTLTVTDPSGKTGSKSAQIIVILTPDIDGSGRVDIVDIAHIAFAFGSKNGDANYDPTFDLNWDGKIDIVDVALAAFYFGRTVGS